jgi:hypothetical protein
LACALLQLPASSALLRSLFYPPPPASFASRPLLDANRQLPVAPDEAEAAPAEPAAAAPKAPTSPLWRYTALAREPAAADAG